MSNIVKKREGRKGRREGQSHRDNHTQTNMEGKCHEYLVLFIKLKVQKSCKYEGAINVGGSN